MLLRSTDDFLNRHPGLAACLLIVLTVLCLVVLAKTVQWRRDRGRYIAQAERMAAITTDMSLAYARGLVALGWLIFVGFLLMFAMGLWVTLFHGSYHGKWWVLVASQACLWAGLILPYFYRPRWAMPGHARSDLSPFQERRQHRRRSSAD